MSVVTPIGRSVKDAALDVINAAETLAEMRLDRTADAMRERMRAGSEAYFAKLDRERGRG